MALPSNQLPKPMTPPKPPRLTTSKESTQNKVVKIVIDKKQKLVETKDSQGNACKVVVEKNKVKPPILPKPQNLKPKTINNGETSVIDSSRSRETSKIHLNPHLLQNTPVTSEVIEYKKDENTINNQLKSIRIVQSNIEKNVEHVSLGTPEIIVPDRNDETCQIKPIRKKNSLLYCNNNPCKNSQEAGHFPEWVKETNKQSKKEHFNIFDSESKNFESKSDNVKEENRNIIPELTLDTDKEKSLQLSREDLTNSSNVIDMHHKNENYSKVKAVISNFCNEKKDASKEKSLTQPISLGNQEKIRGHNPLDVYENIHQNVQNGTIDDQDTTLDTSMRNNFNPSNNANSCPFIENVENRDSTDCSAVESNSISSTCSNKSLLVFAGDSSRDFLIENESNSSTERHNKTPSDEQHYSEIPALSCTTAMRAADCQENLRSELFANETCTKKNTSDYEIIYENIVEDIEPNHPYDNITSFMTDGIMQTETRTAQPSFLHSRSADSLKLEVIEKKIETLISSQTPPKTTDLTPSTKELNKSIQSEHHCEEHWKSSSLGRRHTHPLSSIVDGYSARSCTSLVKNDEFKNNLSNVLNKTHLKEPLGQLPSSPCFEKNPEGLPNEEPIYAEPIWITPNQPIRPAPERPPSLTNPNDRDSLSDASEDSNDSWSEIGDTSLPTQPHFSVLQNLVTSSFNLLARGVSSKVTEGNASPKMKTKIKRNPSDRSTRSFQEDNESIGSDSTEDSYTRRNKSWLRSFRRDTKRSSQFYPYESNDNSLTDQTLGQNDTNGSILNESLPEDNDPARQNSMPCNDADHLVSSKPHYTEIVEPLSPEQIAEKKKKKAFLVAQEIMTSEKEFIGVLSLLRKDMKEQCRSSDIPDSELNNLIIPEELLTLNETLYKDFEERIKNWDTVPKIADIFVKKGPFLKLYTTYCQNFQARYNLLDECCSKYPVFQKKLKEFEMSDICKKLTVKHYLLKPIQRIPQYKLLLEQYLNQLEPDSTDYEDAGKALHIVSAVADHANGSMKLDDQLRKLLDIQYQLGNYEIIKPGRVFIKEGQLLKLSRRGKQERFFILLSDCLLYTSYYGTQAGYHLNYELPLNGMKVCLPKTEDYQNEFSIITVRRSFTLQASSIAEREEWVNALETAIKENQKHLLSFINHQVDPDLKLGKVDAVWIPDDRVSMCQLCTSVFTVTFRRHHCRACGKVVCGPCSSYEAPLQCKKFRSVRVCQECFEYLTNEFMDPDAYMFDRIKTELNLDIDQTNRKMESLRYDFKRVGELGTKKSRDKVPDRLLEVTANDDGAQVSGWLNKKSGRSWKRYWFVLKDHVLYRYKASEDIAAEKSVAILGYDMTRLHKQDHFKYVFELNHVGSDPLVFGLNNEQAFNKWMSAMSEATKPLC